MFGGEDSLKRVQMWGHGREEEQEGLGSEEEEDGDITSEESGQEEEYGIEQGPSKVAHTQTPMSTGPLSASSRPIVGDKCPPGNK